MQILKALNDPGYGWQHHPAVNMWRGYEAALARYGLIVCEEWISRGYKDTCYQKIVDLFGGTIPYQYLPYWLTEEFVSNHRAILLGKAEESRKIAWKHYFENDWDSKARARFERAIKVKSWYQQWNWVEQPATMNENGRWPYLWPESLSK